MSALPIPLFPGTFGPVYLPRGPIDFVLPEDGCLVNLDEWVDKARRGHVLVQGFPHNVTFFEPHREWLIRELIPRPGEFFRANDGEVVLHIRWGDYFNPNGYRLFGYPLRAYDNLLSSIEFSRCLIVTDTPDNMLSQLLVRNHRAIVVAGNIEHDYRTLYHARRIVMSPSTFSWWAAFSGQGEEIYQPHELGFWKKEHNYALELSGQNVKRFNQDGRIL